jgi:zinc protease
MQTTPVSQAELTQAKGLLLRQLPLSESSIGAIANGLLSRAELGLPLDEPTRAARRYIKLTAAQVRAAFTKWLDIKQLVQVSEGPAPK